MSDTTDPRDASTPIEEPGGEERQAENETAHASGTEKTDAEKTETENAAPAGAPAGTTTPGALFDMAPKKPEPAAAPKPNAGAKSTPRPEPKKYAAGTEVRYGRERVSLPREMSAKEVLDWMSEDDYPELRYEESDLRHDKDKNRLVVVRRAQKKGRG